MLRTTLAIAVALGVATCNKDEPVGVMTNEPHQVAAQVNKDVRKPRTALDAAHVAAATPTCQDAADVTMRIVRRALPEMDPFVRQALIDQCRIHPWDEAERRCMVAAEEQPDAKDAFGALGVCHHTGDCRRHPDWKSCRSAP